MNIPKNDHYFWNSNLFFKYQRFEKKKAKMIKSFKVISDSQIRELDVEMDSGFTHLNIFKGTDSFVNLVALDNYESPKYPFKDYDPKLGKIKLKFSGKNFKKSGKHKLYLIQSTYPVGKLSKETFKSAISFDLLKN
jgi:hypothetical protein